VRVDVGDHLVLPAAVSVNQLGFVVMLGLEQPRAFSKAAARVVMTVPFMRADSRQEMLHRRLVAGEELAVEMPRILVDQNTAEVEHDDAAARLCHRPLYLGAR
jgi:hypothetical protein